MLQTVGLMGGELTCLKQGPGVTPHGVQANGRQIMAAACSGCKGRFPVEGGNDVTLTHRVTRVTSKVGGARPRGLFDQKRHELGGGQVCREISEVSRGHPENKRTATLTVLTVHSPGLFMVPHTAQGYNKLRCPSFSTGSKTLSSAPHPL